MYQAPPPEDVNDNRPCGILNLSMYGTRDAASNWEAAYAQVLEEFGFTRGVSSPCVCVHHQYKIRLMVHGDDFFSAGSRRNLLKLKELILSAIGCSLKRPSHQLVAMNLLFLMSAIVLIQIKSSGRMQMELRLVRLNLLLPEHLSLLTMPSEMLPSSLTLKKF